MSTLTDKDELENYLNDLIQHPQKHENDPSVLIAGALIHGIQSRDNFDVNFDDFLKNMSLSEKKRIKDIISYTVNNSSKPLTDQQKRNFSKLKSSLPGDKHARKNELKRSEDDIQFLNSVENDITDIKRKIGELLRKKNVDENKVKQLQESMLSLQNRVKQLIEFGNKEISNKARKVSGSDLVFDKEDQIQSKLDNLDQFKLELTDDISHDELNKLQARVASNTYAYSHLPQVREKAKVVMLRINEIRNMHLDVDKLKDLSIIETLNEHKKWNKEIHYTDPKFGDFNAELIKGFYVMRKGESGAQKNDIKMHISIDSSQAKQAMGIIHELASSPQFSDLIEEYKIGDVEHILEDCKAQKESVDKILDRILSSIEDRNLAKIYDDLKSGPPKSDDKIAELVSQVPEKDKSLVKNELMRLVDNQIGTIVSGERILNEALFTVYFKKDFKKEDLEEFCKQVNQKFSEKEIKNGNVAQTDIQVNPYCMVTVDHILDDKGNKVYLEAGKPEDVEKRQKALRENPLTKDLIGPQEVPPPSLDDLGDLPPPPNWEVPLPPNPLKDMAGHVDGKDDKGMSAYIAKNLSEIPLDERVELIGQLVAERYKQTNNVNLVYRNPDMYAKWMVKETMNELKFPVAPENKKEFFEWVRKALATPPDEQAKAKIKECFDNASPEVTKMLLPFYHDYLESAKSDFKKHIEMDGHVLTDHEYEEQLEERLKEAKKSFLGHVSFPFVESLVFELQEKDGFTPQDKAKLSAGFRELRSGGIMESMLAKLDEANKPEVYVAPNAKDETIEKAYEIYQKGKENYKELLQNHSQLMVSVEKKSTELYKIVNKVASRFPEGDPNKEYFQQQAGRIENLKTELDHKLLRGEKITNEDVRQVHEQIDRVMEEVRAKINEKNELGSNLLHESVKKGKKDLTDALLSAGANPSITTSNYKRGILGSLKDAFGGKPKDFFKNLTTPKPLTAKEISDLYGFDEITQAINTREQEIKNNAQPPSEEITQKLEEVLKEKPKVEPEVDILKKSEGLQFDAIQDPPQQVNPKANFISGWTNRINEEIGALKSNKYPTKQESIAIYALNQVLNFLSLKQEFTAKDLVVLNKVIDRVTNEATVPFPPSVKKILSDMKEGKELVVEDKVKARQTGPKSEFTQKWEEEITPKIGELKTDPINQYILKEINNFLKTNPALDPQNVDGLTTVLSRLKKEGGNKINEYVKSVMTDMQEGKMPYQPEKPRL